MLVIDGKNNNDDGMFIGKNSSDDGMYTSKKNNNDDIITGRMCQAGTRSLLGRGIREISKSSKDIVQSCTQSASVRQGQG
jgi:hypothetical protein